MRAFQHIDDRLRLAQVYGMFVTDDELAQLDRELDEILESIERTDSFESAEEKLRELGRMQVLLATICFKYNIELSERQRKLVREYDRWDVTEVRAATFAAIKTRRYL